ncbi:MAG: hypothetical protein NC402_00750 [Prevotella sp.]|nr:hypothetical protein [Prevotella sp.]MCM1074698.1 hypothetical protein [Ruminococcus sp.]
MANKREFKKYVSEVANSVCSYMMDVLAFVPGVNEEEIHKAVITVLTASETAIVKTNVKFDKGHKAFPAGGYSKARRAFFNTVYAKTQKEFNEAIEAAVKIFNAAVPAEIKEQNKKLLNA